MIVVTNVRYKCMLPIFFQYSDNFFLRSRTHWKIKNVSNKIISARHILPTESKARKDYRSTGSTRKSVHRQS